MILLLLRLAFPGFAYTYSLSAFCAGGTFVLTSTWLEANHPDIGWFTRFLLAAMAAEVWILVAVYTYIQRFRNRKV